jgi:hypothetical protein
VSGLRENALRIYWWASVCAIAFAFGLAIGVFKVFPYRLLQDMAYAARELARYPLHTLRISPEKFVAESPPEGSGVVRHVAGKPVPGVTLVAGFFEGETGIRLIDLDGAVLNEWRISYNAIWPESPHLGDQPQDWDTELHGAMLLPDGGVVFTFQYGGLIRMDRCSRVEWKLPRQTHHLFSADADGNFWVPGREERREALPRFPKVEPVFQEDLLLKVSPDGVVLQEISILDAIFSSGLEGLLFANGMHDTELSKPLDGDFTHLNDIEVLTPALAPAFPMFEAGDLLVSLRNLNLLLVVDPGTGRVKWKRSGSFLRQHDPDFLPARPVRQPPRQGRRAALRRQPHRFDRPRRGQRRDALRPPAGRGLLHRHPGRPADARERKHPGHGIKRGPRVRSRRRRKRRVVVREPVDRRPGRHRHARVALPRRLPERIPEGALQ